MSQFLTELEGWLSVRESLLACPGLEPECEKVEEIIRQLIAGVNINKTETGDIQ